MKGRSYFVWILVLPSVHLLLCLKELVAPTPESWFWLTLYLVDLPFSYPIPFMKVNNATQLFALTVIGTLWWLFVNWVAVTVVRKMFRDPGSRSTSAR
jgi:hypothetical protein